MLKNTQHLNKDLWAIWDHSLSVCQLFLLREWTVWFKRLLSKILRIWKEGNWSKQTEACVCVSYICSGPQLLDDHLYPVHHLLPHSCFLRPRRHEVVEVHHLLVESGRKGGWQMSVILIILTIMLHTDQCETWIERKNFRVFLIAGVYATNNQMRICSTTWLTHVPDLAYTLEKKKKNPLQMAQDMLPSYHCSG